MIWVAAALMAGLGLRITPAAGQDPTGAGERPEVFRRYIVQLRGAPLARYDGSLPGIARPGRDHRGKLVLDSAEALAYLAVLDRRRAAFEGDLRLVLPQAEVHHRYRILYNGITVKAPTWSVPVLKSLPNVTAVRSTDRVMYYPFMDHSLPIIGAQTFWDATVGIDAAGDRIKVAVIDTGIDHTNPFFHDVYFQMPLGYPRGATAFTSAKVIAARAYFRPDDPVDTERDEPNPMDHQGHGSHCAGTIAGVKDTVFDLGGFQATVSGVAPRAYLMNYKVFYRATSGTEGAHEPELMAAFEDAVTDGADVISNSWGGPDVFGPHDPSMQAYEAAVEAGCIVVFAAGNEGPGDGSVGSPGSYRRFITVGATTTGRYFTRYLDVTAPAPVPSHLEEIQMSVGRISSSFSSDVGPAPLMSSRVGLPAFYPLDF
jgi:subtilisin family serine protease